MHKKLSTCILCLMMLLTFTGCGTIEKEDKIQDSIFNLEEIMSTENYQIIDVRTKEEYLEEHIKEAINIPLDQITNIDLPKDTILLVYCKSGGRSSQATSTLKNLGYTVHDLGAISTINLEKE